MKISKKGEYALKALMEIAYEEGKIPLHLHEISTQTQIPEKFLEQIMILLKRSQVVRSLRGKAGGYVLARPASSIVLGDIIRQIDGPLAPIANAEELKRLIGESERYSGLYSVLLDVRDATAEIMDQCTLADVCERTKEQQQTKRHAQMYYI